MGHSVKHEEGISTSGRTLENLWGEKVKSIMLLMVMWAPHGLWEGLDFGLRFSF